MTVKEVKKRIGDLGNIYDNMIKIQECCLRNENAKDCIKELEEAAQLNVTIRNLASATAGYIRGEICRLEAIIDNAVISIN